ncbi:hypothetical protein [Akkermansia sp.]|uniref:hypothetical protein n=1 Tax=Akkermansia sp. TaxID=1872421 RepID=UPI0025C66D10|nr:hypothetical protein [Akkermansia sp.]MCD8272767.1 hypothetical protein [Akkermansia sp.]
MPPSTTVKLPAQLVRQLRTFRRRLRTVKMLEAVCLAGIAVILSYALLYLSDRLWETPPAVGWFLFFIAVSGLAVFIPWWSFRWVWQRRTEAQLARLISRTDAALGDRLLGVIELDSEKLGRQYSSEKLKEAAMEQVAREVSVRDLTVNIPRPSHKKLFVLLAVLAAGTAAVCAVSPEAAGNALKRWVRPFNPPERYTFTQLDSTPDSLVIPLGESFLYEIRLAEGTKARPQTAEYFFRNRVSQQAPLTDGTYKIHIPPMQQADCLEFFAGDAVRRLKIIPKSRPSLLGAEAGVAYPAYMARANGREAMRAGIISAPEGSTLTLKVSASQRLQSAEDAQGRPLRVEGSSVIIPNILLEKEPREIELGWMDSDGLAAARPVKIRLEPVEDKQPSIYLRGGENDRYVLEDTSIELEVEATDDFGIREIGVEWQGEKSFYEDNNNGNGASAPKPDGVDKPAPGPRGEKVLADGQPTQTGLKGTFLFQARALKLSPQRVVVRGVTQDYKPGGKRVYSEPMIIFVLSKSEHAQMIRNELERITSELEGMIRRMDAMADEAKRLKGMESGELKNAESQERLHALADEEQASRRELGDLLNRSESLFKEASRNSQIDPAGMKEFMKGISMLKPIPGGPMKKAQKQFRDSASENRSEQERRKDLNDGENSHSEATQALKDAMNQLSKSAQDMEASTFVARLKQAASKEDSIAHALAGQINTIAGMTMEELDPSSRREMETIATLQNASTQDIGWILEDLSYYKSRTGERIYSDLYNQMNAFSLREKLDLVHGNILNAITARSIDESRLYASTLRHWAKLIDDYKKSRGGGGGGGGGGGQSSISDAEFEFMLKIIRMIQQEQDIRMRTRAAEQERRKQITPPAP